MEEFLNKLSNIKNDIDVNIEKINDIKSSFRTKFNINSTLAFKNILCMLFEHLHNMQLQHFIRL